MSSYFDFPAAIAAAMGIIIVVFAIVMFFTFGLYILRSVGLYTLAKNRGMSGAGLAWIPVIGVYRIGAIADDIAEKNGSKTYYRHFILGGTLLSWLLTGTSTATAVSMSDFDRFAAFTGIGTISWLLPIAMLIITAIALNMVYKCYRPDSATAWTVLSVIFAFLQAIFLFRIRNDMPAWGSPPQGGYYPPQQPDPYWQAPPPPQNMHYAPPQAPNPPSWEDGPPSSGE